MAGGCAHDRHAARCSRVETAVNGTTFDRACRGLAMLAQVGLMVVLLMIGIPTLATIKDQVESGYVPFYFPEPWFIGFVAAPFVIVSVVALALIPWRRGRRRFLILADALAALTASTVMLPYLFANELPIAAMALAIVALALAGSVALRDRAGTLRSA